VVAKMGAVYSQVAFVQFSDFHQGTEQPDFKRAISVNGYYEPFPPARHYKNMMATLNSGQRPAFSFDYGSQFLARDLLHRANSMTRSLLPISLSGVSTESQPSTASRKLWVISSMVSPWVTQPGKAGTSAQNPPSWAS